MYIYVHVYTYMCMHVCTCICMLFSDLSKPGVWVAHCCCLLRSNCGSKPAGIKVFHAALMAKCCVFFVGTAQAGVGLQSGLIRRSHKSWWVV